MKFLLVISLCLCFSTPKASSIPDADDEFCILPEIVREATEPIPEDAVFNTTNHDRHYDCGVCHEEEINVTEGGFPLCVLVFGDEEVREDSNWKNYAPNQIERADETLVAEFGIDIRILGFQSWCSPDTITHSEDLWKHFNNTYGYYLGSTDYEHKIDCLIALTGNNMDTYGLAPGPLNWGEQNMIVLIRWFSYWADDNIMQHEISHLFTAWDHEYQHIYDVCCVMADDHTHYVSLLIEDGQIFWIDASVYCVALTNSYCETCFLSVYHNRSWCHPKGDVNGDFKVDMRDVGYTILHFGSTRGSPNWDPSCDVADEYDNFVINMRDVGYVASLFLTTID